MQKLELFDETFDPDRTESYELSIQFTLNGFSFCVKDIVRNCFIALVSAPYSLPILSDEWIEPIKSIRDKYDWVTKPFKKVLLSFESPVYTFVPQGFFEISRSKLLLERVHPLPEYYEIRHNSIHDGITSIFALPSALVNAWMKLQPNTHFIGFNEPVLAFHRAHNHSTKHNSITIANANSFIAVIISKGLELQVCTSIEFHTHHDTAYHLVNMCKNTGIPTKEVFVRAIGSFNDSEQLELVMGRFFMDFKYSPSIDQNHFSYMLGKYKGKYANLFNQSLCEL